MLFPTLHPWINTRYLPKNRQRKHLRYVIHCHHCFKNCCNIIALPTITLFLLVRQLDMRFLPSTVRYWKVTRKLGNTSWTLKMLTSACLHPTWSIATFETSETLELQWPCTSCSLCHLISYHISHMYSSVCLHIDTFSIMSLCYFLLFSVVYKNFIHAYLYNWHQLTPSPSEKAIYQNNMVLNDSESWSIYIIYHISDIIYMYIYILYYICDVKYIVYHTCDIEHIIYHMCDIKNHYIYTFILYIVLVILYCHYNEKYLHNIYVYIYIFRHLRKTTFQKVA